MNVFLLLGSNMGDRLSLLHEARTLLAAHAGAVVGQSGCYESEPWGFEADTLFMNQALQIDTRLTPMQLLSAIQRIERQLGRERTTPPGVYASRPIDIDILFYDNLVIDTPALTVPHPLLHRRRFALLPLCDLALDYTHPVLHKTISELLQQCGD